MAGFDVEGLPLRSWQQVFDAAKELTWAMAEMDTDAIVTREALRQALDSTGDETAAIMALGWLDVAYSEALVDELVGVALSHRSALRGRELLGRHPYAQAGRIVPSAVWRLLQEANDYDAYRRMAELLSHLGLNTALSELCDQAGHVVEGNLRVPSGRVVVMGCTDYLPDAARVDVDPGWHRVRAVRFGTDEAAGEESAVHERLRLSIWSVERNGSAAR
jgi:hypothetical protein